MGGTIRATALATAAVALLAAAGCGLRADERPQPIPRERLSPKLFEEGSEIPRGASSADIFVLTNQAGTTRLQPVTVPVAANQSRERVVLEALLAWTPTTTSGTSPRQFSRIPSGTALRDVRREGRVLTVDLSDFPIAGSGQAQAAAQIVYTADRIEGIDAVIFLVDGKAVAIPLGESSSTPGDPVEPGDFELDIEPSPTTTAAVPPLTTTTTATTAPPSSVAAAPAAPAARDDPTAARLTAIDPDPH
jgi:spore germination protein GerM